MSEYSYLPWADLFGINVAAKKEKSKNGAFWNHEDLEHLRLPWAPLFHIQCKWPFPWGVLLWHLPLSKQARGTLPLNQQTVRQPPLTAPCGWTVRPRWGKPHLMQVLLCENKAVLLLPKAQPRFCLAPTMWFSKPYYNRKASLISVGKPHLALCYGYVCGCVCVYLRSGLWLQKTCQVWALRSSTGHWLTTWEGRQAQAH